jgi:hypothetical protein
MASTAISMAGTGNADLASTDDCRGTVYDRFLSLASIWHLPCYPKYSLVGGVVLKHFGDVRGRHARIFRLDGPSRSRARNKHRQTIYQHAHCPVSRSYS